MNEYPWLSRLNCAYGFCCGGSLIAAQWVVTAAHCVLYESSSNLNIILGEHDATSSNETFIPRYTTVLLLWWRRRIYRLVFRIVVPVSEITTHPFYKTMPSNKTIKNNFDYDIALLKLAEPVDLTIYTQV